MTLNQMVDAMPNIKAKVLEFSKGCIDHAGPCRHGTLCLKWSIRFLKCWQNWWQWSLKKLYTYIYLVNTVAFSQFQGSQATHPTRDWAHGSTRTNSWPSSPNPGAYFHDMARMVHGMFRNTLPFRNLLKVGINFIPQISNLGRHHQWDVQGWIHDQTGKY